LRIDVGEILRRDGRKRYIWLKDLRAFGHVDIDQTRHGYVTREADRNQRAGRGAGKQVDSFKKIEILIELLHQQSRDKAANAAAIKR
jgi:hypothetical protein